MYEFIEGLGLDLSTKVSSAYLEIIYDCIIQLTMGLEYAHNNGLVHGQLDLSSVLLTREGDTNIYKVADFRPLSSMSVPLTSEGSDWPFARQKKKISDGEKIELLMLKDIYALGICILELMIGRQSESRFSISLDSLPLTWAQYPESTPLIQVLAECINVDSISQRKGKLQNIRRLLIREYKKMF
jgi:serine/threonine protein kinase